LGFEFFELIFLFFLLKFLVYESLPEIEQLFGTVEFIFFVNFKFSVKVFFLEIGKVEIGLKSSDLFFLFRHEVFKLLDEFTWRAHFHTFFDYFHIFFIHHRLNRSNKIFAIDFARQSLQRRTGNSIEQRIRNII
jgi:hypothetical protein